MHLSFEDQMIKKNMVHMAYIAYKVNITATYAVAALGNIVWHGFPELDAVLLQTDTETGFMKENKTRQCLEIWGLRY